MSHGTGYIEESFETDTDVHLLEVDDPLIKQ